MNKSLNLTGVNDLAGALRINKPEKETQPQRYEQWLDDVYQVSGVVQRRYAKPNCAIEFRRECGMPEEDNYQRDKK